MNGGKKGVFREGLRRGLGIGTGIAVVNALVFATLLYAQDMLEFVPGQVVSAGDINGNFTKLRDGMTNLNDEIEAVRTDLLAMRTDLLAMSSRVDGVETGSNTGDSNLNTSLTTSVGDLNLRLAPVGSIVAWHKNLTGVPSLPPGWMECNGAQITDPDSPMRWQWTPNLNNRPQVWNSKGAFLRGHVVSGIFENDQFQGHGHAISPNPHEHPIERQVALDLFGGISGVPHSSSGSSSTFPDPRLHARGTSLSVDDARATVYGAIRHGSETRSTNMSVVWIMRVK